MTPPRVLIEWMAVKHPPTASLALLWVVRSRRSRRSLRPDKHDCQAAESALCEDPTAEPLRAVLSSEIGQEWSRVV